jgi:hypothetical protein
MTHALILLAYKTIAALTVPREAVPYVDKMSPMLIHQPPKTITTPAMSRETVQNVVKRVLLLHPD